MDKMTDWETLSIWQKITDDDPRRPAKTWKSRIFWTWPIHIVCGGRIPRESPRFMVIKGTESFPMHLKIKTTKFKGETYEKKPASNYFMLCWHGWFWGWK